MKLNNVRIFGIILFSGGVTAEYLYRESNYGFVLGIMSAIGIMMIYYGRFNIFRGIKK
jgi:hypothetical protein